MVVFLTVSKRGMNTNLFHTSNSGKSQTPQMK